MPTEPSSSSPSSLPSGSSSGFFLHASNNRELTNSQHSCWHHDTGLMLFSRISHRLGDQCLRGRPVCSLSHTVVLRWLGRTRVPEAAPLCHGAHGCLLVLTEGQALTAHLLLPMGGGTSLKLPQGKENPGAPRVLFVTWQRVGRGKEAPSPSYSPLGTGREAINPCLGSSSPSSAPSPPLPASS